jgi:hypothetical protein
MNRCKCGKRINKYANQCKACYKARTNELRAEGLQIANKGTCPTCGRQLRRNSSLPGWWQCEQYGAEGFRAEPSQPSCDFQLIIPEEVK